MAEENKQVAGDGDLAEKMEKLTIDTLPFRRGIQGKPTPTQIQLYTPENSSHVTVLWVRLHAGEAIHTWTYTDGTSGTIGHAEKRFLYDWQALPKIRKDGITKIEIFINWSPCWICVQAFLEAELPETVITYSKLYYTWGKDGDEEWQKLGKNIRGLEQLKANPGFKLFFAMEHLLTLFGSEN